MPRTFIAFPIEEKHWSILTILQHQLKIVGVRCRLIKPENFHVTVAFLGELSLAQLVQLNIDLKDTFTIYKPLALTTKAVTGFPVPERTRAVAIKLGGKNSTKLQRQVSLVKNKLRKLNVTFDQMPFVPHVSIGRIDRGQDLSHIVPLPSEPSEIVLKSINIFVSEMNDDRTMKYQSVSAYLK